ncbi:MAG: hypothetical protein AB7O62_02035 [Pirellulales bacterium]
MSLRTLIAVACIACLPLAATAQTADMPDAPSAKASNHRWRESTRGADDTTGTDTTSPRARIRREVADASPAEGATVGRRSRTSSPATRTVAAVDTAEAAAPRTPLAKVISGKASLPGGDGQVWREYDISGYTARISNTNRPEQAIIDWILRETGYEAWHSEPVGLLTANKNTLICYHTPQMQEVVGEIVDRYINPEVEQQAFALRVITIDNPNWRAHAQRVMQAVPVETQGVQAWLMHQEDAALLVGEMRRRNDFREHSSPNLMAANGQSTVVSSMQSRSYIRDVMLKPNAWPGYENAMAQLDEGFSLELSPLLSLDGQMIDAILKCNIDQVEKMHSIVVDVPTANAPRQKSKLEVPQMSHCRVAERFRWPANQVLLIGLGVVATPVPSETKALGIPLPKMVAGPARANLLVMVESRGKVAIPPPATAAKPGEAPTRTYNGRY